MWPGVDPRLGLPLVLGGAVCYGWLLAELHPTSATLWWGLAAVLALLNLLVARRRWRTDTGIADVLAGRREADPELLGEIERVARRVDDLGIASVWAPSLVVIGVALAGLGGLFESGDWVFLVPLAGILLYAVLASVLLRRRRWQVRGWLAARPGTPDRRSTSPVPDGPEGAGQRGDS